MSRRFPAEWEPHRATLFTWPWDAEIWGREHDAAQNAIAASIAALSHGERVIVHVPAPAWRLAVMHRVRAFGGNVDAVEAQIVASNDVWVRDHGPTLVREGKTLRAIDWNFNAWGGKFPHGDDAGIAAHAAQAAGAVRERAPIVFEGGAIETNGEGVLLSTRSVALTDTRNPGATEAEITAALTALLGVHEVVWLDAGMGCDDTDGHIDTLARFAPNGSLLVHVQAESSHPDAAAMEANAAQLAQTGRWPVVRLAAPTLRDREGALLPASYANFYIGNEVVLAPTYGAPEDSAALAQLAAAFPKRRVVPVDCRALVSQGGAIHCATQQVPALG